MNTLIENQLGLAMLISLLGMFAVMIFAIYIDVLDQRRNAAEAEACEAEAEACEAEAEAEIEQRRLAEWELSDWAARSAAYDHGESGFHPGPRPSNFYSQF